MVYGFFVIGGPQAAGKSTVIKYLHSKYKSTVPLLTRGGKSSHVPSTKTEYKNLIALQEMRQIVIHKYNTPGGIFVERDEEVEIVESDLARMDRIMEEGDSRIFLDECNVFTLAHSKSHDIDLDFYFHDYMERLRRLGAYVIFLDVSPGTSWARRRTRYEERTEGFPPGERESVLQMYHDYLFRFRPFLEEVYERVDLPKTRINMDVPVEEAFVRVSDTFEEMAREQNMKLTRRF